MNNQINSKRIIIIYGLIAGIVAILIGLITYSMGKNSNPGLLFSTFSFIIPFTIIILGIKKYKKYNHNFLSWEQAIKTGIGIALIWGALTLSFQYALENVIDPNLMEEKLELQRKRLKEKKISSAETYIVLSDEAIDKQIEKQRNQNPLLGNAMGLLLFIFLGFVVSAIAGAIMKKTE